MISKNITIQSLYPLSENEFNHKVEVISTFMEIINYEALNKYFELTGEDIITITISNEKQTNT